MPKIPKISLHIFFFFLPKQKNLTEINKRNCRRILELRLDVVSETNIILNIEHWNES